MDNIESIAEYLKANHLMLTTAESCTAGLIAARLVDVPGAGEILDCAFVTYSEAAKKSCLHVNAPTIEKYGLTSVEVSAEMARGALARSRANSAIANTGVTDAMPDGPPPGTQCFAWAFRSGEGAVQVFTETHRFLGERNEIRAASADFALMRLVDLHGKLRWKAA